MVEKIEGTNTLGLRHLSISEILELLSSYILTSLIRCLNTFLVVIKLLVKRTVHITDDRPYRVTRYSK